MVRPFADIRRMPGISNGALPTLAQLKTIDYATTEGILFLLKTFAHKETLIQVANCDQNRNPPIYR